MKALTRTLFALALVSGVVVASEINCPEALEANACGLLASDGYDRTPGAEHTAEQNQIRSRALAEISNQQSPA